MLVVPADAKSIATNARWRNPVSAAPGAVALRTSCRVRTFFPMDASGTPPQGSATERPSASAAAKAPSAPIAPVGAASPFYDPSMELRAHVEAYQRTGDLGTLLDELRALARRFAPDALKQAAHPYRDLPEVVIPLYERIVADSPTDAQAMVVLANAYWLTGRGPAAVTALAERARAIDPANRGAWHLWALAQADLRKRVDRWLEVTRRFPADQLARAALADHAASLANDESDPAALKLAISTYEGLLAESTHAGQRLALEEALATLRKWRP